MSMAVWLASTICYQHPKIHPLPLSLLSATSEGERKRQQKTMGLGEAYCRTSLGEDRSMHEHVRKLKARYMGNLGTLIPPNNDYDVKGRMTMLAAS